MKEHPILFTGPMVRAILEGRKTQTRRPIKAPKGLTIGCRDGSLVAFDDEGGPTCVSIKAPFAVGDRLWVRETWVCVRPMRDSEGTIDDEQEFPGIPKSDPRGKLTFDDWEVSYHADGQDDRSSYGGKWRPSIHMPRWASRLTLDVTAIRPERLQAISEADAMAEGARFFPDLPTDPRYSPSGPHCRWSMYEPKTDAECLGSAAFAFGNAWNRIYGEGPFAWTNNPWTWATTFKVVTP